MRFSFNHCNINVLDIDRSVAFYREALGLSETRRKEAGDGSFVLVFLGDEVTPFRLELTWLRDRKEPYSLGDNEFHQRGGIEIELHQRSSARVCVRWADAAYR